MKYFRLGCCRLEANELYLLRVGRRQAGTRILEFQLAALLFLLTVAGSSFLLLSFRQTTALAADDTAQQAQALLDESIRQNVSDHVKALKVAYQAVELWQRTGDQTGIAKTYSQIGLCYLVQSDLAEATQSYQQALDLWRSIGNDKQEASTLIMLSFIEVRKGEWASAISLLTQAQEKLTESDAAQMGQITATFADIFTENGMPEHGLALTRKALEYYRQTPDDRDDKRMVLDIGNLYFLLGKFPEALSYIQQALASFAPDNLDWAECHESLGRVLNAMGEKRQALEHLRLAVPIYERIGNPAEAARTRALIGQTHEQMGQIEEARQMYQQALATFQKLSDPLNEASLDYALGRMELSAGKFAEAEKYLRTSIDETENVRRVPASRDLTAAFSASVYDRYAAYIECLMQQHQAYLADGYDVRAFEASEMARARSLADLLHAQQIDGAGQLDPGLALQEKSQRQALRAKEDYRITLLSRDYRPEELSALNAEVLKLEAEYQQLRDTIRERYPSFEQLSRPTALTLRQIQQQVLRDNETVLLEYSLGEKQSYAWVVTPNELHSAVLPGRAEIGQLALRLRSALLATHQSTGAHENQEAERARAVAETPDLIANLSQTLLSPVADKLKARRIIVVADGELQYIPFQVLSLPGNGRALVEEHEIVNEPSASTLALIIRTSGERMPPANSVAVLADPVFNAADGRLGTAAVESSSLIDPVMLGSLTGALRDVDQSLDRESIPRLAESRTEADAILKLVPWLSSFKATDFDASRSTAMSGELSKYRIVHFATHAILDEKHPQSSGIVLSLIDQKGKEQDGFLRLHDIYNLKLPVDLVVLSACQTGLGKDVKGEGLIGLTRGFMYAGAAGVVASLWKVDDEATAELMKYFYTGMFEKGLAPAAALRDAQLAMMRQKRWQEPYYWAGFVIQGQYAPSVTRPYQMTTAVKLVLLATAAALILSAVLILWRRRRRDL